MASDDFDDDGVIYLADEDTPLTVACTVAREVYFRRDGYDERGRPLFRFVTVEKESAR